MQIIKLTPNKNDYLAGFLDHCTEQGLSKFTITSHKTALTQIQQPSGAIDLNTLKDKVVQALPPTMGNNYYNKRLQSYRHFCDYLVEIGTLKENPLSHLKYKRAAYKYYSLAPEDINKFLSGFRKGIYSEYRDYVFCITALDTGIRPQEMVRLEVKNIDFIAGEISLPAEITKTQRARIVPISPTTGLLLRRLISYQPSEWKGSKVFCGREGRDLKTHSLQSNFSTMSKRTGVKVTPYMLRHVFATIYVRNGGNLFTLKDILGHTSIKTTQIYVNLNIEDVKREHARIDVVGRFIKNRCVKLNKV